MNFDPIETDPAPGATLDASPTTPDACPPETTCFYSPPGAPADITCPAGERCVVDCRAATACHVDCNGAAQCVVACSANCLVDNCPEASCNVTCPGATYRDETSATCL